MADGPARIKAFGDFGITAWTTVRNEDLPIEAIGPIEYVRADIADELLKVLIDGVNGDVEDVLYDWLERARIAIAKAKGEANG